MVKGEMTTSTLVGAAIVVILFLVLTIFPGKIQDAWTGMKSIFGENDPDVLYDKGVDSYLDGEYTAAKKSLTSFINTFPGHPNVTAAKIHLAMVHAAQGNKKSSSDLIEEILKTDNLPGDVASPLYSQEREISSSSTSYDWGCINYGSAGCIYGIKANTDPCICRMGIE